MEIMRKGLSEILPGVCCRIGADEALLPRGGCAFCIISLKRGLIVITLVAEDGSTVLDVTPVTHQPVPIIMADFVAEMIKQRTIWFAHGYPELLPHPVIGFGERQRDNAIVMAGHNLRSQ